MPLEVNLIGKRWPSRSLRSATRPPGGTEGAIGVANLVGHLHRSRGVGVESWSRILQQTLVQWVDGKMAIGQFAHRQRLVQQIVEVNPPHRVREIPGARAAIGTPDDLTDAAIAHGGQMLAISRAKNNRNFSP